LTSAGLFRGGSASIRQLHPPARAEKEDHVNNVNLIGRLTRDPELRSTTGGTSVCKLRVAYDQGRDSTGYVDVTVFQKAAEDCAEYLVKGQEVGISARLQWREWDADNGSGKRQAHELIAQRVDFLRKPKDADSSESDVPAADADLVPAGAGAEGDGEIPF
jgi:single-strand DNA-binding protein